MQQIVLKHLNRFMGISIFMLAGIAAHAQEKIDVDINKEEIGSWFEQNWMWIAGGIVLLLLIALLGRSNRRSRNDNNMASTNSRKTTTVIKDADGNTRSITTREENI